MCCMQIHVEAQNFAYQTGVKVACVYGGAPINQQVTGVQGLYFSV